MTTISREIPSVGNILASRIAFEAEYQCSEIVLEHFVNFVKKDIIEVYSKSLDHHSQYFSMVQSSGYGKTRLVLEAGKGHLNVVYCCLRRDNSNGYPPANSPVRSLLLDFFLVETV